MIEFIECVKSLKFTIYSKVKLLLIYYKMHTSNTYNIGMLLLAEVSSPVKGSAGSCLYGLLKGTPSIY